MTTETFRALVLSFPGTIEKPHVERTAFKVANKRIFATLLEQGDSANLKLPLMDQEVFCAFDQAIIYPVQNKWGLQGWTTFELRGVPPELMRDALETAYNDVFKKTKSR